jgi:DNA-binding transcriptional ArsR family regulator
MNLDKILASDCRRNILRVLREVGSTNVMDLVRRANSTYNRVSPNLQILGEAGIVSEQRIGHIRWIKLEREKPKTKLLLEAIKILDKEFAPTKQLFGTETADLLNHEPEAASLKNDALLQPFERRPQSETPKSGKA